MMRLLQSSEMVIDVGLKRVGWFRWEAVSYKKTKNLYQCSDCGSIVSLDGTQPIYECNCAPCRICGEVLAHKKHASKQVIIYGNQYNCFQWNSATVQLPTGKHYYSPERRKSRR